MRGRRNGAGAGIFEWNNLEVLLGGEHEETAFGSRNTCRARGAHGSRADNPEYGKPHCIGFRCLHDNGRVLGGEHQSERRFFGGATYWNIQRNSSV
jgi:hypothetical protein